MAKPNRGGKRGSGSFTDGLTLDDGTTFEFEGTLTFGADDATVTATQRQAIEGWEAKRSTAKVEYAYAVDANGNPIGAEVRGSKGSVKTPYSFHFTDDGVFTHIHPRTGDSAGILGGTFSTADSRNFTIGTGKTVRAVAKEGTYSLSKTSSFDSTGFMSYVSGLDTQHRGTLTTKAKKLASDYRSGKITYDDYAKAYDRIFNSYLVELHNGYLAGQKQYGYTYTLERRK